MRSPLSFARRIVTRRAETRRGIREAGLGARSAIEPDRRSRTRRILQRTLTIGRARGKAYRFVAEAGEHSCGHDAKQRGVKLGITCAGQISSQSRRATSIRLVQHLIACVAIGIFEFGERRGGAQPSEAQREAKFVSAPRGSAHDNGRPPAARTEDRLRLARVPI